MIQRILDHRIFDRLFDYLYDFDAGRCLRAKHRFTAEREEARRQKKELS